MSEIAPVAHVVMSVIVAMCLSRWLSASKQQPMRQAGPLSMVLDGSQRQSTLIQQLLRKPIHSYSGGIPKITICTTL